MRKISVTVCEEKYPIRSTIELKLYGSIITQKPKMVLRPRSFIFKMSQILSRQLKSNWHYGQIFVGVRWEQFFEVLIIIT